MSLIVPAKPPTLSNPVTSPDTVILSKEVPLAVPTKIPTELEPVRKSFGVVICASIILTFDINAFSVTPKKPIFEISASSVFIVRFEISNPLPLNSPLNGLLESPIGVQFIPSRSIFPIRIYLPFKSFLIFSKSSTVFITV